ncbi:MAG: radical SAM family heme chaperone HemW [Azospirillaceae bacterium]|nr:radical SAM family heme chaperone HemW [Azospirillaceae bacterium]
MSDQPDAVRSAALDPGFGIYIHWPFCRSKCPYCDFNSHVRDSIDQDRWRQALLTELDHYAAQTPGRTVTSVFFGGGTPSLMPPATAAALLDRIAGHWATSPDLEVSLEANPTSAEADSFAGFRAAGVNRLSLGIQALDDTALRFLGRRHDVAEATAAIRLAARCFDRFSFDLIYARPGQEIAGWRRELDQAVALAAGHLSLYQLTIEEGTAFHTLAARGDLVLPEEDRGAALFEITQEVLERAGLPGYEISNHARPGQECRHNLTYWRYGDYIGIGPGAHGRLTRDGGKWAIRGHRAPEIWMQRVEQDGHGSHAAEPVTPDQRWQEMVMMGLRLAEGIRLDRIVQETGAPLGDRVDAGRLARLIDGGFLETDDLRLRATSAGRQRLNAVLGMLLDQR